MSSAVTGWLAPESEGADSRRATGRVRRCTGGVAVRALVKEGDDGTGSVPAVRTRRPDAGRTGVIADDADGRGRTTAEPSAVPGPFGAAGKPGTTGAAGPSDTATDRCTPGVGPAVAGPEEGTLVEAA
ncbi:hypothetical protein [Streptomyces echinatus]|uniref:hypothetical protein n=1 Tax=Streptomyces echinatus TaxID=67293 RepID=UPI0031E86CEF